MNAYTPTGLIPLRRWGNVERRRALGSCSSELNLEPNSQAPPVILHGRWVGTFESVERPYHRLPTGVEDSFADFPRELPPSDGLDEVEEGSSRLFHHVLVPLVDLHGENESLKRFGIHREPGRVGGNPGRVDIGKIREQPAR